MPEPGNVLGAKYRLECEIGRGGMGSVWRATRLDLGTEIALKIMHAEASKKPGGLERFSREAKAAASLTSPHVVRIIDFGVDATAGHAFMAMELLEGESLAARLESGARLSPPRVASIITQVARALAQAHALGIVHRDLKPANIFLVRNADDELVKLLDFGVAKAEDGLATATGSVLGTPHYMSPEQVNAAKDIDHRTDLWSLAVIACECLTGRRPFFAETLSELAMKIALGRAEIPSSLGPVPPGFDAWFARATAVDPAQRFQSASELANALTTLTHPQRAGARDVAEPELALAATLDSAAQSAQPAPPTRAAPRTVVSAITAAEIPGAATTTTGAASIPSPTPERTPRPFRRIAALAAIGMALIATRYLDIFSREQPEAPSSSHPSAAANAATSAPSATTAPNAAANPTNAAANALASAGTAKSAAAPAPPASAPPAPPAERLASPAAAPNLERPTATVPLASRTADPAPAQAATPTRPQPTAPSRVAPDPSKSAATRPGVTAPAPSTRSPAAATATRTLKPRPRNPAPEKKPETLDAYDLQ